jgi:FkbM family methyltransferase
MKGSPVTTVHAARRAADDIRFVCRYASAGSAARWLVAFTANAVKCAKTGSLTPADQAWTRAGARFQLPGGPVIALPGAYTAGAREMYCRNVYLRTGLIMPQTGWVVDLGANRGLFSVWAAMAGAEVVAVEAQQGFAPLIRGLAAHNGVETRVHVKTAFAGGATTPGATVGVLADDYRWATASHGATQRPPGVSVPEIMSDYRIERIGLLKVDIEGGEFAVFGTGEDLWWLERVDQIVLEVHPDHGDATGLIDRLRQRGYRVDARDNGGIPVGTRTGRVDYAYCRRP